MQEPDGADPFAGEGERFLGGAGGLGDQDPFVVGPLAPSPARVGGGAEVGLSDAAEGERSSAPRPGDVSGVETLPAGELPREIRGATKRLVIDLLSPAFGLAGESFPEKVEGLAFGPDLPDGRRTLVVTTDNDFKDGAPSWVWVFALNAQELK